MKGQGLGMQTFSTKGPLPQTWMAHFGAKATPTHHQPPQGARNEIEKLKLAEMTAREAVFEVAKILHKVGFKGWGWDAHV